MLKGYGLIVLLALVLAACGKEFDPFPYYGPEHFGVPQECIDWMSDWQASYGPPPAGCEKYAWHH
jgi:hypothetical protein